jgi:hypothetical protein
MATIWQTTFAWTGFPGATGYTNLYYLANAMDAQEALNAVTKARLLFDGVKATLPNNVNIAPVTDVRLIQDTDGKLLNIFTVSGVTAVQGTGGVGAYSGPSGGCIDWLTGQVHGRHLATGRTFIVPMIGTAYENNGTLAGGIVTTLATAAEAMRTAGFGPTFGVWGRPRKADPLKPDVPALVGAWHPAIVSRVPDKAVVLRSRRD